MRFKKIHLWIFVPIGVSFLSLSMGRFAISFSEVWGTLVSLIFKFEVRSDDVGTILLFLRMPRIVVALLIGGALGASGATYQAIFRNPLASPDILGVSAGAGFGGLLAMLLGLSIGGVWLSATFFGLVAMSLTVVVARKVPNYRVGFLLAGLIVTTIFSSLISLIKILADPADQLPTMVFWLMGSLSYSDWSIVRWICFPIVLGLVVLNMLRWRLNLLTLGQNEAKGLGLNTNKIFYLIIVMVTMMTAISVSVVGIVGWIGLVIPHLVRLLVGENNRQVVPLSMILGGSYLVLMDSLARSISAQEIPIGILTAMVGAVVFIFVWQLAMKREANYD